MKSLQGVLPDRYDEFLRTRKASVAIAGGMLIFLIAPVIFNEYIVTILFAVLLTITLASSWNLFSGFTGYLSFGHVGFFGLGAYAVAILSTQISISFYIMLIAGGVLALVLSLPLIVVTVRLSGVYFAVIMFAFTEIILETTIVMDDLTEGTSGIVVGTTVSSDIIYVIMVILTGITVVTSLVISRSSFGMALRAIRDDEEIVGSIGINSTVFKGVTLSASALLQGLAGAITAAYWVFISPSSVFSTFLTIDMIMATIIGGIGTVVGPIVGSIGLVVIRSQTQAQYPYIFGILFGLVLMVFVLTIPDGLVELYKRSRFSDSE